jgi:hypothetical protein
MLLCPAPGECVRYGVEYMQNEVTAVNLELIFFTYSTLNIHIDKPHWHATVCPVRNFGEGRGGVATKTTPEYLCMGNPFLM